MGGRVNFIFIVFLTRRKENVHSPSLLMAATTPPFSPEVMEHPLVKQAEALTPHISKETTQLLLRLFSTEKLQKFLMEPQVKICLEKDCNLSSDLDDKVLVEDLVRVDWEEDGIRIWIVKDGRVSVEGKYLHQSGVGRFTRKAFAPDKQDEALERLHECLSTRFDPNVPGARLYFAVLPSPGAIPPKGGPLLN